MFVFIKPVFVGVYFYLIIKSFYFKLNILFSRVWFYSYTVILFSDTSPTSELIPDLRCSAELTQSVYCESLCAVRHVHKPETQFGNGLTENWKWHPVRCTTEFYRQWITNNFLFKYVLLHHNLLTCVQRSYKSLRILSVNSQWYWPLITEHSRTRK